MTLILALGALALTLLLTAVFGRKKLTFSPPSVPFLGAALIHPQYQSWKTYAEWGRRYGYKGLVSFHILGKRIDVVNSRSVAEELFNKRSNVYNNRPFPTMSGLLMKRNKMIFFMPYNERCKTYRRLMHHAFNSTASQAYWSVQEDAARILVQNIIDSPQNLLQHVRLNAAYTIMKIAYGYTIEGQDDYFIQAAEEAMRVSSLAIAPGKWLVDSFPLTVRFLPDWLPGSGFKQKAKAWTKILDTQVLEAHNWVKEQIENGTAVPSFVSNLLLDSKGSLTNDTQLDENVLWASAALYAAGTDTSATTVNTFVYLMVCNPEVQKRAQAELDAFISEEQRLPNPQDRTQGALPYLTCVLQEVLRWHPAAPLGLPHETASDDVYEGYFIPANTTIIGNIWAMMHDPEVYPNPEMFDPDRFIGPNTQEDPRDIIFGFGRRICPGRYVAESTIWIQAALLLACVNLDKARDETGMLIEPHAKFVTALVSYIEPFPYQATVRSQKVLDLLRYSMSAESSER